MSKYNIARETRGDREYVFVTRGRSKPFSQREMDDFFVENGEPTKIELEAQWQKKNESFSVTNSKIFAQDLRAGLDFCARKYGVTTKAIEKKAAELFPHMNLKQLLR